MNWHDETLKIYLTLHSFERPDGLGDLRELLADCQIDEIALSVNDDARKKLSQAPLTAEWLRLVEVIDYPRPWLVGLVAPGWGGMDDYLPHSIQTLDDLAHLPNLRAIRCPVPPAALNASVLSRHVRLAVADRVDPRRLAELEASGFGLLPSNDGLTHYGPSGVDGGNALLAQINQDLSQTDFDNPAGCSMLSLVTATWDPHQTLMATVALTCARPDEEPEVLTHDVRSGFARRFDSFWDGRREAFGPTMEQTSYALLNRDEASTSSAAELLRKRIEVLQTRTTTDRRLPDTLP